MITLVPLGTMTLTVANPVDAGNTPAGRQMVAEIVAATVSGRLAGRQMLIVGQDGHPVLFPDGAEAGQLHDGLHRVVGTAARKTR